MSKIIVTGATRNAGSAVLTAALASSDISDVTVLSRRPPHVTHDKLSTIILPSAEHPGSFEVIPQSVVDLVKDHRGVVWAQGVSQTQVNKDEYIKITHDYPVAAAKAFKRLGTPFDPFRFVYISGEGTHQDESGSRLFSKIKGRTEKELQEMENESFKVISIRPGGIVPTEEHSSRMDWKWRYGLTTLGAILDKIYPSLVIDAADLGRVSVEVALGRKGWNERTMEGWIGNSQLRKYAKEMHP